MHQQKRILRQCALTLYLSSCALRSSMEYSSSVHMSRTSPGAKGTVATTVATGGGIAGPIGAAGRGIIPGGINCGGGGTPEHNSRVDTKIIILFQIKEEVVLGGIVGNPGIGGMGMPGMPAGKNGMGGILGTAETIGGYDGTAGTIGIIGGTAVTTGIIGGIGGAMPGGRGAVPGGNGAAPIETKIISTVIL